MRMQTVHPHACGEYDQASYSPQATVGSSPRVWGILDPAMCQGLEGRFIPTRVGNTGGCSSLTVTRSVHPHACGEYKETVICLMRRVGSSPRVWGIPRSCLEQHDAARFIPTRVGNTLQEDARNNRLLAELQRATEPCVLQACSDDDKKGKELCKAAPSPRKTLPGGQSRSLDVTCPDRRNARPRS